MSDNNKDNESILETASRWAEINRELRELDGKTDPESVKRFWELLEELMCVDMAMAPLKNAMGRPKKDDSSGEE